MKKYSLAFVCLFSISCIAYSQNTYPYPSAADIGIGTISPSARLDLTTNALGITQTTASGLALSNTTAATSGLQQISPAVRWSGKGFATTSQAVDFRAFVTPIAGATTPTGYLGFGYSLNGATYSDNQLVLTTGGNVGVGTTAPGAKLELLTTSSADQLRISYSAGTYTALRVNSSGALIVSSPNAVPAAFQNGITTGTISTNINIPSGSAGSFLTNTAYSLGGTDNVCYRVSFRGTSANTLVTDYSAANFLIGTQSILTAGAGSTHALVAQQAIKPLTITNSGATVTNSASLYIENAATGAQNNYALWVANGFTRLDGAVGIGTNNIGSHKLAVEGTIGARKLRITQTTPWPDYVFEQAYTLPTLKEIEAYIKTNKHLPDVPSAKEVQKDGLDVGDNQATLLRKIEELTLYVIELKKQLDEQTEKIQRQGKLMQEQQALFGKK